MNNIIKNKNVAKERFRVCQIPVAFLWGLAESSLFFIVPDVWLTIISRHKLDKTKYQSIGFAILGALVGGTLIYWLGWLYPRQILDLIAQIPGINWLLVRKVQFQVDNRGLLALMLGPLQGIPYKIFAAQWGINHGNLIWFWIISIPARGIRFAATAVLTRFIWIYGERRIKYWNKIDLLLLISFWVFFYLYYFHHFGW